MCVQVYVPKSARYLVKWIGFEDSWAFPAEANVRDVLVHVCAPECVLVCARVYAGLCGCVMFL